jgi:zinc transport system substrate-binding protein
MQSSRRLFFALFSVVVLLILTVIGVSFYRSKNSQTVSQIQPVSDTTSLSDAQMQLLASEPKLKVVASFYPLADFAKQVGGQAVDITNMTPAGAEPHDFEPKAQDIQNIYKSQIFIFNGAGLDPWADKIQSDLESNGVKTIKMSDNFQILKPLDIVGSIDGEQEDTTQDPHIWTDPVLVKKQVQIIRDMFDSVDSTRKTIYDQNADSFTSQLDSLDSSFRSTLKDCVQNEVVTSHNFLQYLGNEYGFSSIPISGISPDSEPSSKKLAELADLIKSKNIKYIFTENLISPKLSQTIAAETGAQVLVLNPIEGLSDDQIAQGQNYLSVQKDNLKNLSIALECK